jgi:NDP-sugar pyrophosphorylase family protein
MKSDSAHPETAGIILAGTHPWANSGFDMVLPRPLLPVAHRPLLSYALSWFHDANIREIVVCGNRESHAVQSWLIGHVSEGMRLTYHQDLMPRGAGGSLHDAASLSDADVFVVADGTAIPNVSLDDLRLAHAAAGAAATVVVHSEPRDHGNVCLQIPSGIYVFCRRALEGARRHGFCDIKEHLIPQLYRSGEKVISYAASASSPRVLDAQSYLSVNTFIVERLLADSEPPAGFIRSGDSLVHEDAVVAADASLIGAVSVCQGARVGSGAVIVGPATIGRDVTIGEQVLISRSAIWRRSSVGDGAFADRCILTDDSVIESRTGMVGEVLVASRNGRTLPARPTLQTDLASRPSPDLRGRFARLFGGAISSRAPAG